MTGLGRVAGQPGEDEQVAPRAVALRPPRPGGAPRIWKPARQRDPQAGRVLQLGEQLEPVDSPSANACVGQRAGRGAVATPLPRAHGAAQ